MSAVNFVRSRKLLSLLSPLALVVLVLASGCSDTPDYTPQRVQVRAIQHNNAMSERHAEQAGMGTSATSHSVRHTAKLSEDDYRVIRHVIAKPSVTPSDAAQLPYGSNAVLMRFMNQPRFRRYGPTIATLLGMIGDEVELAFLREYLENDVRGGIDEFGYRTLLAIPPAIGYLAIHNEHAYATLRGYLRLQFWRENIQWRFTAKDRDLNVYRLVMASLDGLAVSGRRGAIPYVEYMIEHECGSEGGRLERTRTLMDERLEARARQTVASLSLAN